jgi:cysteine synthase B
VDGGGASAKRTRIDETVLPPTSSDELTSRMRHLVEALAQDNPALASDVLFPREAYVSLRDSSDAARGWEKNVSEARKDITQAFGTELVHSDPMEGSDGAIRLCSQLVEESPNVYFYADQYKNPSNPRAHYLGTGREILEQVGGEITHFVAGLGTSGTCMGTTRRLHEHTRKVVCVAAQPAEALHGLEGLKHMGSSIVPDIYDAGLPDEHMAVNTEDGWDMADRLAQEEGLHVGHSTGANVWAALDIAKRIGRGCVVTVACDRGDRYFAPMRWEKHYEW